MSLGELGESEQLAVLLHQRWLKGDIYTKFGPLLIAVKPEGQTVDNHGADGAILQDMAEELYTNIKSGMGPQTVLAQGLSGSGKTYTFTRLMESLLEHLQTHSSFDLSSVSGHVKSYSELMDVFGSAQTPSNAESSRFGKAIEFVFDSHEHDHSLLSVHFNTFLFERSRTSNLDWEPMHSNFAALQQLASCADDYPDLHLDKHFPLCNGNGPGIGPKKAEWHSTIRALQNLLGPEQASEVVCTLAGILHLTTLPTDRSRAAEDGTLEIIASCLGLPTEVVQSYFYERKIGNDKMLASPAQVETSRDSLICHLYSKIFQAIEQKLNQQIQSYLPNAAQAETPSLSRITIVDVCGFEAFDTNSLEQLIINYLNEELHYLYTSNLVQTNYTRMNKEGVFVNHPVLPESSTQILDTIRNVFKVINDTSRFPKTTEMDLLKQLRSASPALFGPTEGEGVFSIRHWTGTTVGYQCLGMLARNKFRSEQGNLLNLSKFELLRSMSNTGDNPSNRPLAALALDETTRLLGRLRQSTIHNLICVNPTDDISLKWNDSLVRTQLLTHCVWEAISLLKSNWPIQLTREEFARRFTSGIRDDLEGFLMSKVDNTALYAVGKTCIFLKHGVLELLDIENTLSSNTSISTPNAGESGNSPETPTRNTNSLLFDTSSPDPIHEDYGGDWSFANNVADDDVNEKLIEKDRLLQEYHAEIAALKAENERIIALCTRQKIDAEKEVIRLRQDAAQRIFEIKDATDAVEVGRQELARTAKLVLELTRETTALNRAQVEMNAKLRKAEEGLTENEMKFNAVLDVLGTLVSIPDPMSITPNSVSTITARDSIIALYLGFDPEKKEVGVAKSFASALVRMSKKAPGGVGTSCLAYLSALYLAKTNSPSTIAIFFECATAIRTILFAKCSFVKSFEKHPKVNLNAVRSRFLAMIQDLKIWELPEEDTKLLVGKVFGELKTAQESGKLTALSAADVAACEAIIQTRSE